MHKLRLPALACTAFLLSGCVTMEQASSNISCMLTRVTGTANSACGPATSTASSPSGTAASGTASNDRFSQLQSVLDKETQQARQAQAAAVQAMRDLPANLRATAGPVRMLNVNIEDSQRSGTTRSMQALDSITVDLPLAAKGRTEYTRAMDILKDLANTLANNRGAATIAVEQAPADVQAKRVNTAAGITKSPQGNPVNVQKTTTPNLPTGLERYTIRAGEIRGKL